MSSPHVGSPDTSNSPVLPPIDEAGAAQSTWPSPTSAFDTQTDPLAVPFDHAWALIHGGTIVDSAGDLDRVFRLASVTKVLATRSAVVAVDRGLMALNDPMGPPGATLRHLLSHSSGMAQDSAMTWAAPGARRIYSDAGIELMGTEVEAATNQDISHWIAQTILDPLSMDSTTIPGSPAHSGLSTIADLTKLADDLLHPRLVSAELDAEATRPVFPDLVGVLPGYGRQNPNPFGLGVEIRGAKSPHWTAPNASPKVFGHFGQSGSFIWVDRELDAAAVFLGTEPFGPWHRKNWAHFNEALLAKLHHHALRGT